MRHREYDTEFPEPDELRLRQLTVDEALPRLTRFLHDTYRDGFFQVKIVHGKGTGMLRDMVMRELKRHPLVKSFRAGGRGEGGAGVTIVEFSDK